MPDFTIYLILICAGVVFALLGVLVGGWLVFKGKSPLPNEPFIGRAPKGEVFNVNTGDGEEFPEETNVAEEHVLKRAETFLKNLGGG